MVQAKREGKPLWRTFWVGDTIESAPNDGKEERSPRFGSPVGRTMLRAMTWGVTLPWTLLLCAALGIWMMFAPDVFGTVRGDTTDTFTIADSDHLFGALIAVVAVGPVGELRVNDVLGPDCGGLSCRNKGGILMHNHARNSFMHRASLSSALAALFITGALSVNARAQEFAIDKPLPEFTLKAPDGTAIAVEIEQNKLVVAVGEESHTPKVMLLHFLQPDCLQCQNEMKALQSIHEDLADRGVLVLGVAHRGDRNDVRSVAQQLGVTFPLAMGTGSDIAKKLAAGDAMAMIDSAGIVRFKQVGYRPAEEGQPGDEALWRENINLLLQGKPVKRAGVDRKELKAGDRFPEIRLNDVFTNEEMVLTRQDGRLVFTDHKGNSIKPKAAIGLFSRYCDFTRQEMRFLQRLSEKYGDDGLFVFTIAMMPDRDAAPAATRDLGVEYPVFYGYGSDLGKRYAYGCPAYIVDANGIIQYTQVGFETEDEKKYDAAIQEVLEQAP